MKKLNELKIKMENAKAAVRTEGKEALKEAFMDYFDKYPGVKGVVWAQYTPYFNDGEQCVFRVRDLCPIVVKNNYEVEFPNVDVADYIFDEELDGTRCIALETYSEKGGFYTDLRKIAKVIDNELALLTFGDHVRVVATRAGFKVNEYEHD